VFFGSKNGSKRAWMSKSQMKKMLTTFFDIKCFVHFEFIPQDQIGNQTYYMEIMKLLREGVHNLRPTI
jgi:hypothetical protein